MNELLFKDPAWWHATTLTERMTSQNLKQYQTLNNKANKNLARQRLQRWKSQAPFATNGYFTQRLALNGLTENEFLCLLGEPIEAVQKRLPNPPWLADLCEAFSCFGTPVGIIPMPEALHNQVSAGFLNLIEPLINQSRSCLREGVQMLIEKHTPLPFDPNKIENMMLPSLLEELIEMLSKTMVLELNVARLQGLLKGDTAEERFTSFIRWLRKPDVAVVMLQEYSVLTQQLVQRLDIWVNVSLEFLDRLCNDWHSIRCTFCRDDNPGLLTQIYDSLGDVHKGGRSVTIAEFGSGFKVVYKPKSLAVDVHFQELLAWLNQRGDHPPFRTFEILNCGTYGWVEFVAAQDCASSEEIERFYERQGGYLALLYALEATDFHFENVIAAGEHPVLVDLESLLHQRTTDMIAAQPDQIAVDTVDYSVLRVGLLPERLWGNDESDGIDISGLGAPEGQLSPSGVPYWEKTGTDKMHLTRKRMPTFGAANRPTLNGANVKVLNYDEAIVTGFTKIYRLLQKYKGELFSKNGPIENFAEDEVRVLLRPTMVYGTILQESFHPDMLRNALTRDQFFDKLWVNVEQCNYLRKVINYEKEDLQRGDIPMFTARPNSRDIWNSSGDKIASFFAETGLELVQRRLQQFCEDDLAKQIWFIRASIATLAMHADHLQESSYRLIKPKAPASRECLLTAAVAIGNRLEILALRGKQSIYWFGLTATKEGNWSLAYSWADLYGGLPGITLFLAYLGTISQEPRYTTLAQATLTTIQYHIKRDNSYVKTIGAFNGWGSVIYILTHLGVLWGQSELLTEADAIVELLPSLIEQDELFDVVGGSAGCIISLARLHRLKPSKLILEVATQCGDHLIACAQPMAQGIGWPSKMVKGKPLTGFSHGAAGIALALLELSTMTGQERFRVAALDAMTYERSLFSPKTGNWPDLRQESLDQADSMPVVWCYGAPGVGLARLDSLQHLDDAEIRAEIDVAIKTTLAQGFGMNHSLCHGDLGNLELLLQASQVFDDAELHAQTYHIAAMILESIEEHGWLCGVPMGVETPGLMTGLAGIGYQLLRLAAPERVPSVLTLEPPRL